MDIKQALHDAVWSYQLRTSTGVTFWPPYIRNDITKQDPDAPRGLGKSTPEEILESAEKIVARFPEADAEEIRKKLIDGSLPEHERAYNYRGVDCSGFTYHVMNRVYNEVLHKELVDELSVPKDDVLNGARNLDEWKAAHPLSQQEADRLPQDIPMRWVVETFKRKPQNLCRVRGLVSDFSSVHVDPKDMRIGDLVHVDNEGDPVPHVCIVYDVNQNEVQLAHSTRKTGVIGGVIIDRLPRDENGVPDTMASEFPHRFLSVRRLKSLC